MGCIVSPAMFALAGCPDEAEVEYASSRVRGAVVSFSVVAWYDERLSAFVQLDMGCRATTARYDAPSSLVCSCPSCESRLDSGITPPCSLVSPGLRASAPPVESTVKSRNATKPYDQTVVNERSQVSKQERGAHVCSGASTFDISQPSHCALVFVSPKQPAMMRAGPMYPCLSPHRNQTGGFRSRCLAIWPALK